MKSLAYLMFYNQRIYFALLVLYTIAIGLLAEYVVDNPDYMYSTVFVFSYITVFIKLIRWRDKYYQMSLAMKAFYTVFIVGIIVSVWIILFLIVNVMEFFGINLLIIYVFLWFLTYYVFTFDTISQFEYRPLFRSEFRSKSGFRYPHLGMWILYVVLGISYSYFRKFTEYLTAPDPLVTSIFMVLYTVPPLLVLNQIFWEPTTGVAEVRKEKVYRTVDPSTPQGVMEAYTNGQITPDEYYTELAGMRKQIIDADIIPRIRYLSHIIETSNDLGKHGKRGKILIMSLLPSLLEKWSIFALLPKHLQKLSHDFLEMLILTGEMTNGWEEIIRHEYEKRVSVKMRFSVFLSENPDPPKSDWILRWEGRLYRGKRGFKKAGEKYQLWIKDNIFHENTPWEQELENVTLRVMRVFYGVGSRKAWGASVDQGIFNVHEFVARGNFSRDFDPSKIKRTTFQPPPIETRAAPPKDEEYLRTYLETGAFPAESMPSLRSEIRTQQKKLLKEQKVHIVTLLAVTTATILLTTLTSLQIFKATTFIFILLYIIYHAMPASDSAVKHVVDLNFSQFDDRAPQILEQTYKDTLGNTFLVVYGFVLIYIISLF